VSLLPRDPVAERYVPDNSARDVERLRTEALKLIGAELGIDSSTVSDKYRRQLKPEMYGTMAFDRALYEWLKGKSGLLKEVLLRHALTSADRRQVEEAFSLGVPNTPYAIDLEQPESPERAKLVVYRVLRDTLLARAVKRDYGYRCQICEETIELPGLGRYAEAHHVRPLGRPHNGPDVRENIICVCPKHHVMLDYGAMRLEPMGHISTVYVEYHNTHLYRTS